MSKEDWAAIRIPRDLYTHVVLPAMRKVGPIIGSSPETSGGRTECLEHICRMVNDTPIESLKKELE